MSEIHVRAFTIITTMNAIAKAIRKRFITMTCWVRAASFYGSADPFVCCCDMHKQASIYPAIT